MSSAPTPTPKPTPESLAQLAADALPHWGLSGSQIELHTQRENTVYRVVTPQDEVLALRIHRQGYHTLAELESEHAWTQALAAAGLDVPDAVPTLDGRAYAEVALPGIPPPDTTASETTQSRQVGLVRWIEGIPLAAHLDANPSDAECAKAFHGVGGIIADFHAATAEWTVPSGFARHSWDAEGYVGEAPFWGRFWEIDEASSAQRQRLSEIRDNLRAQFTALPKTPDAYSMIHADLHPDNILTDGDALVVIDFDDAGFGWHAFDLAASLWDRQDAIADRAQFQVAYEAIVAGYRAKRPNCAHVIELVPVFLLMRTLMLLRWMQDRPEAGFTDMIPMLVPFALAQADELGI